MYNNATYQAISELYHPPDTVNIDNVEVLYQYMHARRPLMLSFLKDVQYMFT